MKKIFTNWFPTKVFLGLFLMFMSNISAMAQETTLKAAFITDVETGRPPLTVHFTDQSTGNPVKWNWNFGDGTFSNEQNPVHTYYSCGVYTISLTVSNDTASYGTTSDSLIKVVIDTLSAPVIYSTASGGDWSSESTWIGGVVPTANDNVVVDGDVVVNYSKFECKNLIISKDKKLSSTSFNGSYAELKVHGDLCNKGVIGNSKSFSLIVDDRLINDGSIGENTHLSLDDHLYLYVGEDIVNNGNMDDSQDGDLRIYAYGDIVNRGSWKERYLYLSDTVAQTISGSSVYQVGYFEVKNSQKVVAGSSLHFQDSYLLFHGSIFEIPDTLSVSFTKVTDVNNYISQAQIQGGGSLILQGGFFLAGSSLKNITLSGDVEVSGNIDVYEKVSFSGMMENRAGQYPNVYFHEDFVNNGEIKDNTESGRIYLYVYKNLINNSQWKVFRTYIDGTTDQTIQDNNELSVNEFILKSNVTNATTFQWYKDDAVIDYATNSTYYIETDKDYSGTYYCQTDAGNSRKITLKNSNAVLAADFSSDVTSGRAPLTVQFTDLSTGNVTGWNWDFGDGTTSTEQNPSHTYTAAGTYDVSLTVTDGTQTDTKTVSDMISVQSATENSITSTAQGGRWNDPATWIGGVVPGKSDDVIIDGPVGLLYTHECNNLTINKGDTLYTVSSGSNNLKVYGNIVNNGAVILKSDYTLYPYKNITTNGSWDTYYLQLEYGTEDQTLEINGDFTFAKFRINANVSGATKYQWYRNGQEISGATGSRYYLYADKDYTGTYYCHTDAGDSRKITIVKGGLDEFILKEHFDSETFPPAGWAVTSKNTDYTWGKGNPEGYSFTEIDPTSVYSAVCDWDTNPQDEWLQTPAFSLPEAGASLEFYAGYNSYWISDATLNLLLSIDGGSSWDTLWDASKTSSGDSWSWQKINIDLSPYAGNSNVILAWQYVGTDGDLVALDNVEVKQSTTGIDDHQAMVDKLLSQNYPNPFNSQTRIPFTLDQSSEVRLEIYNSLGQQIAVPVSGKLNAGKHEVLFDGSNLHPGMYYYRLVVDGIPATRRMVIMK